MEEVTEGAEGEEVGSNRLVAAAEDVGTEELVAAGEGAAADVVGSRVDVMTTWAED